MTPESSMPAYRWLFQNPGDPGSTFRRCSQAGGRDAPLPGYEVVPTEEGKALVDYLLSLKKNYPLPEAPEPTE